MGDRCYMEITCRKCDMGKFEDIGFGVHPDLVKPDAPTVTMADEEANYANSGAMPTDVPWIGRSFAGDSYPDGSYACDGEHIEEVVVDTDGLYIVHWNEEHDTCEMEDVKRVRKFIAFRKKAEEILNAVALAPEI